MSFGNILGLRIRSKQEVRKTQVENPGKKYTESQRCEQSHCSNTPAVLVKWNVTYIACLRQAYEPN